MTRRTIRTILASLVVCYAAFALVQINLGEPLAWIHAVIAAGLLLLVATAVGRRHA